MRSTCSTSRRRSRSRFRQLAARSGWKPKGSLIYFGVADEEAGGEWGAKWMCDDHWDAVGADYVLTELGGWSSTGHDGVRRVVVNTGEKGLAWRKLRISGTPAHGSMPFGSDRAGEGGRGGATTRDLPTAGAHRRRVAPDRSRRWRSTTRSRPGWSTRRASGRRSRRCPRCWPSAATRTRTPRSRRTWCTAARRPTSSRPRRDRGRHPHRARHHPGRRRRTPARGARRARAHVEIGTLQGGDATESPHGNILWDTISSATQVAYPGAELLPGLIVGGTDARFFHDKGAGRVRHRPVSPTVDFESFGSRFHGNDERIDVESLGMAADYWIHIAKTICG